MRRSSVMVSLAIMVAAIVPATSHAINTCVSSDWPMYGHDLGHTFATPDSCVNDVTAATLHPKWVVDTGSPVTASPTVVGGTVYVGDRAGTFYAVDAGTGAIRWTFSVPDRSNNDYGKIVSSAAVDTIYGKTVVLFGGGATLYMLDAADGSVLDSMCVDPVTACGPSGTTTEIESSPMIVHLASNDVRVVVGMDYNEDLGVGRAGVIQASIAPTHTFTPLWKFDPETLLTYTADPLGNTHGSGRSCGNVWSTPTIDLAHNLIVFGVGNCDAPPSPLEPGDGESIDAIRLDTGALVWRYAPRPADNGLDLDFGASAQVLPGGAVGEGGKDGTYYSIDATTGAPRWQTHVSTASDIGGIIGSTALGEANGRATVFATSAIPFSTRDFGGSMADIFDSPARAGRLHAIDAETGDIIWDAPDLLPSYSAATYSNGVVFLSSTFGFAIQAYDANTGLPLWTHPVNGAPSSAPAIVGNSIYVGSGTAADLPFPGAGSLPQPLNMVGAIWAFQTAA